MQKKDHQWSGAPGTYCTECGVEAPMESALACDECKFTEHPGGKVSGTFCAFHTAWREAIATCPPDRAKLTELRALPLPKGLYRGRVNNLPMPRQTS